MKQKRFAWFLILALLLPAIAGAQAPVAQTAASDQAVARLIEALGKVANFEESVTVIEAAAAENARDATVLLACAQLLFYLDEANIYAAQCQQWLEAALTTARGDARYAVLQTMLDQMYYNGQTADAVTLMRREARRNSDDDTLQVLLASALYYDSRYDQALETLDALLEDSPHNLEGKRLYASILLEQCRWQDALDVYVQIEKEWPEYLDGMYGQFLTYVASGQFDMGIRAIDLLLGAGAEDALWLEKARIRLWKQYNPEAALKESEALLRVDDQWVDAAVVKMAALLMLERYDEAREIMEPFLADYKEYATLMLSLIDMNAGMWKAAEERLTKLIAESPDAYSAHDSLSSVYLDGYADLDGAYAAIRDAFAITSGQGDQNMYQQLGHVYREQGQFLEAARAYRAADAQTFEDPTPLYYLVMCCVDAGRAEDAMDILQEMERRYPGWYETILATMWVADVQGHPEQALEAFEALQAKFPFPAADMTQLEALLRLETGDTDGLELLKAEAEEMNETGAWDTYAYGLCIAGDCEAAKEALAKARERLPEATEENGRMLQQTQISLETTAAEIYLREGDFESAARALEAAAALGWNSDALALNPAYDGFCETEAYQQIMAQRPEMPAEWDLSVPPTIPE